VVLTSDFYFSLLYILALQAKQILEIQLFTFDYDENKSQRTVD